MVGVEVREFFEIKLSSFEFDFNEFSNEFGQRFSV